MSTKLIKQIIVGAAPLFLLLVLYSLFNKNQSNNFDAIPASIESILIIIFCVCFFFEQIREMEVSFVYSSKTFWIIVAILIYMSATFFLFVSTQYFTQEERKAYWFINYISNIIKNLLLATAFIIPNPKPKPFADRPYDDELFERPAI
jgi:magnesium-transporting ATPase (P-type)